MGDSGSPICAYNDKRDPPLRIVGLHQGRSKYNHSGQLEGFPFGFTFVDNGNVTSEGLDDVEMLGRQLARDKTKFFHQALRSSDDIIRDVKQSKSVKKEML